MRCTERYTTACSSALVRLIPPPQPAKQCIQALLVCLQVLFVHIGREPVIEPRLHLPIIVRFRPVRRQNPVIEADVSLGGNLSTTTIAVC